MHTNILKEEFEDTKGVIRICKSRRTNNIMAKRKRKNDKQRSTEHCNQCLLPLMWDWISLMTRCTRTISCDKVCQRFAAGQWFSTDTPVSSTNKTDCHDITEILLEEFEDTKGVIRIRKSRRTNNTMAKRKRKNDKQRSLPFLSTWVQPSF
jgi:mitochondrial fission protein ELM1